MASSQYWAAGKSINAQRAENEGKFPKTVFKKEYGIDPSLVTSRCEWHHSSKFFNKVDYYSIEDVMQELADMSFEKRHTFIKSKKFKEYWLENRKIYLTYEKSEVVNKKEVIIRDIRTYSHHNSQFEVVQGNPSNKQLFHSIYKKISDRKFEEKKNKQAHYTNALIALTLDGKIRWHNYSSFHSFNGSNPLSCEIDLNNDFVFSHESASGKTLFFKRK